MPAHRSLTVGERRRLSAGLDAALDAAMARPTIVAAAHPAASIARAWRGSVAILTRGDAIFWPRAPDDLSGDDRGMAVLQHELQHVLDYRTGRLTAARYLLDPREWTYEVGAARVKDFSRLGAEQRATLAERLWLAENDSGFAPEVAALRAIIPWAAQAPSLTVGAQGSA